MMSVDPAGPGRVLFESVYAALPQTQCTRCGYPDCAAYAQAVASGSAAINQCPPGGVEGVERLAAITGQAALPLNPTNGAEGPRSVAVIDEAWCIGCTLCLDACPTDAIVGSNKTMHTVIEPYCTGCELCIPSCPVDCISLENVTAQRTGWQAWSPQQADTARNRYEFHSKAQPKNMGHSPKTSLNTEKSTPQAPQAAATEAELASQAAVEKKQGVIQAALARARAQRPRGG